MADRVKGAFSSIHATGESELQRASREQTRCLYGYVLVARGFFNNTMDSLGVSGSF